VVHIRELIVVQEKKCENIVALLQWHHLASAPYKRVVVDLRELKSMW
jgi:hypothetical protein